MTWSWSKNCDQEVDSEFFKDCCTRPSLSWWIRGHCRTWLISTNSVLVLQMLSLLKTAVFGKIESVVEAAEQQMIKAKEVERKVCQQDNLPLYRITQCKDLARRATLLLLTSSLLLPMAGMTCGMQNCWEGFRQVTITAKETETVLGRRFLQISSSHSECSRQQLSCSEM